MTTARLYTTLIMVLGFGFVATGNQRQLDIPMNERNLTDFPLANEGANVNVWWLKTWTAGERYEATTKYYFEANTKVKAANQVSLWSTALKHVDIETRGHFEGSASIITVCHFDETNKLCLTRNYRQVDGQRVIGTRAECKSLRNISKLLNIAFTNNPATIEADASFSNLCISLIKPQKTSNKIKAFTTFLAANLEKSLGIQITDGGFELTSTSPLNRYALANEKLDQAANIAAKFQEAFNGKTFLMCFGSKLSLPFFAELPHDSDIDMPTVRNADDFKAFARKFKAVDEKTVRPILQREVNMPTATIWDFEERKAGDVWKVDAKILDKYLHTELKGCFKGIIVLKYVDDDDNWSGTSDNRIYKIRRVDILDKGTVNNNQIDTDFMYDENLNSAVGRFKAKYDPAKSSGYLILDKRSGHLLYTKIRAQSTSIEAMPDMPLTKGLAVEGEGVFTVEYMASIQPIQDNTPDKN